MLVKFYDEIDACRDFWYIPASVSIAAPDNGAHADWRETRKWLFHETESLEVGAVLGLAESASQGCRRGAAVPFLCSAWLWAQLIPSWS